MLPFYDYEYQYTCKSPLNIVVVVFHQAGAGARRLLPAAIQRVEADRVRVATRHADGLSGRLVALEELAEALLADVDGLVPGGGAHLHHGSQKVEAVGDVEAAGNNNEKQKQHGVAKN